MQAKKIVSPDEKNEETQSKQMKPSLTHDGDNVQTTKIVSSEGKNKQSQCKRKKPSHLLDDFLN